MGVLCVEIIGDTRNELSPDPLHDRVLAIGVSYSSDNGATRREIALALRASDRCDVAGTEKGPPVTSVVSPSQTQTQSSNSTPVFQEIDPSPWVFGTEIGVPNANVETHVFADEPSLLIGFANTVKALDPDVLLGFEIQAESLGFLITRGTVLGVDLVRDMSRAENLPGANERQDDEYGRLHASGIYVTGRIVLNLWRVLRGELKLQSYTCVLGFSQIRQHSVLPKLVTVCTYISIYMTDTFRSHAQVRSVRVARFEKTRRQIHTRNRLALGTGRTLRFPEL
jgi:DNA polymerase zeta